MNIQTPNEQSENVLVRISSALIRNGLLPLDGHCSCAACGLTDLDREEIADAGTHKAEFLTSMERHHNGRICTTCADAAEVCDCGEYAPNGTCAECDREGAEMAAHYATERHGWEQV